MAGKSRKRRSKRGSHNNNNNSSNDASERVLTNSKDHTEQRVQVADNETKPNVETEQNQDADIHLYTVPVKTQTGEKLELQLSLGDTVTSTRQFLLDAPETCFITCYELFLHTKDGCAHQLGDHNAISDVADITTGGCSLELVPALYDDRSIRSHLHRTRELLSLSNLHASLSTSLALQNEVAPNKATNSGETTKTEIPELDALGWMEDVSGSLGNLLRSPSNDVKCVESMIFSSFNPPPGCRRLVGDLLYLDVITLEGNTFCVTGSSRMFFVNSSTMNTFDPRPIKASFEATTLVALLQKISPKFKKAFREILEQRTAAHPFENATSLLLPKSWLGLYPEHRRDSARAENSLTLLYGSEPIGIQRDWNEELQSCREFPHTSPQDRRVVHYCRILRDRALYKVTSGFVDAAINGAIGVISGCIPPINPTDPECFHMYVHNNIFFSFAVDADLEQLSKNSTDTSSEKRSTSSLHGSSEKSSEFQDSSGVKNDGSSPEDLVSDMEITQLAESEQATYASVNNDLNGTKAYQEADVPGLYNLAMASIDYRGHRVVAQSVLPGILQGDKSDSLLYGSVDNGRKIYWNEDFHSKVSEAAKRLHLKEHSVLDGSGNVFKLAAPAECKGIVGGDDRHYLIDFLRVTPRDANYAGPGSRFCILRAELIAAFCQAKAAKESQSKKTNAEGPDNLAPASQNVADADKLDLTNEKKIEAAKELSSAPAEGFDQYDEIVFNPNVFTEFKLAGSSEEIAADENNVREVSLHLIDIVIPKFIQDLCTLEVSPMDGQTLTEALHAYGINVRYIGKVASGTKHLPHLWDLITNEIVVRSSKHIIKDVLRDTEDHDLAPAISHLFNCLFGSCQTPSGKATTNDTQSRTPRKEHAAHQSREKHYKRQARWKHRASLRMSAPLHMNINSEALWSDIQEFAVIKYKFELPNDARLHVKKISVVRNLCQKVGITIAARKYDLNSTAPFQTSDVLDLHPVVKHSVPVCSEAKELVEIGKLQLAEGMLSEAYSLFSEAYSILQQVTGPLHREVANCCRYLAMVLYHAGDMDGAISLQHRELIINEQCLGLDHPDTAHSYGNMALFYHGLNRSELALHYMSRALHLLSFTSGPDHPDVAATFIKVAMMYQDIGKMDIALRYLQEALKKNEKLLGKEHIQTAVCYHALAIAFNHMGAFELSHQHEKKTYDILVKQLGEDDSMTRDSQNWMNTFKMREIQMNAQQEKGQALNAASVQKTIHILQMSAQRLKGQALNAASAQKAIYVLKAHPHLTPAFQAAALSVDSDVSANKPLNAAIIGGTLSNRRGIDERGTRAAAEVRKKAAARGLLVHPHGASAQALTPLTKLLNVINSGMTPDGVENGDADAVKKEENGLPLSDPTDAKNDQSKPVLEQPPVGLGKGLTSLNTKKQKSK